jgi:hypothetical protein
MQVQQEIRRPSLQAMALTLAALAALVVAGLAGYLVRNLDTSSHRSSITSSAQTGAPAAPAVQPGQTTCVGDVCITEGAIVVAPEPGLGSFQVDPAPVEGLVP